MAGRLEQGAAKATANIEQAFLRRGFRLAAKAGKVATRPEMSMLHLDNARTGFFEVEQFEAVRRHLPDHLKPLAQVAYLTGWRRGELLSRQWRHIDLKLGKLRLEVGETKNGKGREFPINALPELRAAIETQRARVSEIERSTGQIIAHVFVNPAGAPLVDFRNAWRTARRLAGAPGRLIHDFRRTAVRNLERAGVPRSTAMKLTGHLTDGVYSRYAIVDKPADFAKAIEDEPLAVIPFEPQMFGTAANNGQMISEIAAGHRVSEIFRTAAQVLTGRGETKRPRSGLLPPILTKLLALGARR